MMVFVICEVPDRAVGIELALDGIVDAVASSVIFELGDLQTLARLVEFLGQSSFAVVDCGVFASANIAWQLGVCYSQNIPVIGISENPAAVCKSFPIFRSMTAVVETIPELTELSRRFVAAIREGVETYAELAGETHAEFMERI